MEGRMIRGRKTAFYGLCCLILLFVLNPTCLATVNETEGDGLYLSISLKDPYNADLLVRTAIRIGAAFRVTVENGVVKTTISGTVDAPVDEKYPLNITVTEWASATSNNSDTTNLSLELDRPRGYGPVSSFVYLRTVTLSKKIQS